MFVNVQVTGDPVPTASEADAPPPDDAHAEGDAADVPFSAGNPSVEHVTGVVHLYRHVGVGAGAAGATTSGGTPTPSPLPDDGAPTDQLAVLALPDDVSVGDLCDFLGEHLPLVRTMRLVRRDAAAARGAGGAARLALLRFAAPAAADAAYAAVNGRPFTVLEPDAVCRLVRVKRVTVERTGGAVTDTPPPPPPPGATELPPCPVCLERLDDDVSGVVTTVCNHDFHTRCLSAWGGAACPVCRYATAGAPGPPCAVCGASADLWICLICGHVGCGRYAAGHAARHAADAAHFYSLEVGTGRVWDYAADGYVHRLVQSAALGKLVEVPRGAAGGGGDAGASASGASGAAAPSVPVPPGALWCAPPADPGDAATLEALAESKADAVAAQYSALLAGQLDAQRAFFESELAAARADAAAARDAAAAADAARSEAIAAVDSARAEAARAAERARAADAKAAAASAAAATATAEAADVRALNEGLASAATDLRATLAAERAATAARTADLEEQVRDIALSLDAGAAIAAGGDAGEGGAGGTLLPVPPPPLAARGRRVARGRR